LFVFFWVGDAIGVILTTATKLIVEKSETTANHMIWRMSPCVLLGCQVGCLPDDEDSLEVRAMKKIPLQF